MTKSISQIGNIIQSLTIAIFNIIFLIGMKKGIEGYLMAYILANVCTGLYGFWAGKVNLVIKKYSIDIELRSILTFIMMKRVRLLYYQKNGAVW